MASPLWSVILAAGRGSRLASVTGGVPKQFWSPHGERTLLEETVDRLSPLTSPARMVTVIDRSHQRYVDSFAGRTRLGHVVRQPADRGTAAGVMIGLVEVLARDAEAVVLVTPSDHGVARPREFRTGVGRAAELIALGRADVVLLAVEPTTPVGDYGWIVPLPTRKQPAPDCHRVAGFVEKPPLDLAQRLFMLGAFWSTMIVVARAAALLDLYRRHLPALFDLGQIALEVDPGEREALLVLLYRDLTPADFSRDLIASSAGLLVYVWPSFMGWTDLGTPHRLETWLKRQQGDSAASVA
jgi:mannose-1-phosphate guanylyltransferase